MFCWGCDKSTQGETDGNPKSLPESVDQIPEGQDGPGGKVVPPPPPLQSTAVASHLQPLRVRSPDYEIFANKMVLAEQSAGFGSLHYIPRLFKPKS